MKFIAYPVLLNLVIFLQSVDNAFADVTEGSDIIGKYFKIDHIKYLIFIYPENQVN